MQKTLILLIFLSNCILLAKSIDTYKLGNGVSPDPGLAGNGITDIKASENTIWIGTGSGLSRTIDGGMTFETFGPKHGVGRGSVSALWVSGDTIWVATASDTLTDTSDDFLDMGTGISVSTDNGNSWTFIPQPGPTPIQNITYDIELHKGSVWITSWGGGVQKSDDWGVTWEEVAPDTMVFNPGNNLNHRGFSAISTENAIYIGTAAGINKSTDNGETWTNFSHTNQQQSISGNFVVALAHQKTRNVIWAATWVAEDENEFYGVSKSFDEGQTWQTTLNNQFAHNFAFDDSVVYVATDNGLFKSIDYGESWYLFPTVIDTETGNRIYSRETFSAYAQNNVLWVGTADGLAKTDNNGFSWDVFRSFVRTSKEGQPRTYAYPNPFSPLRHNQMDNDGYVRIQYNNEKGASVTIRVYDFAMDLVTTIVEDKALSGPGDYTEAWNGRNDYGDLVANGVYFFSVELEGEDTFWGKILIMN